MKESEAKFRVLMVLLLGTLASALLTPPEYRIYSIFSYIGIFILIVYLKNGVLFGQRVYPWGIKYNKRSNSRSGLSKKKPSKNGKQHHKNK